MEEFIAIVVLNMLILAKIAPEGREIFWVFFGGISGARGELDPQS